MALVHLPLMNKIKYSIILMIYLIHPVWRVTFNQVQFHSIQHIMVM